MSDSKHIEHCLRAMAWERAKAELYSILATYQGDTENFREFDEAVHAFVKNVEDNAIGGIH